MRYQNPCSQWPQQVVEVSIAATGLVTDFEAIGQAFEDVHHLLDGSHLRALDKLPLLVEGANRNVLRVDIETDVKHKAPLKSKNIRTFAPSSTLSD
jgi:hypothetical protein